MWPRELTWLVVSLVVVIGCVIAAYLIGRRDGYIEAYRQIEVDFHEEVQETAMAKVNRILHDANRVHLPREDAGPSAKIHRGKPGRKPQHRKKS